MPSSEKALALTGILAAYIVQEKQQKRNTIITSVSADSTGLACVMVAWKCAEVVATTKPPGPYILLVVSSVSSRRRWEGLGASWFQVQLWLVGCGLTTRRHFRLS